MGVAYRHAWHPMAEQRLSHFVVDAKAVQSGGERLSKVVEVKVLDLCRLTHTSAVFLE